MLSDDYEQEQAELREKLLQLNKDITQQEEQTENIDRFTGKVRKYLDLDDMVKAVYVHAPDKSRGHRKQRIDISYDFVGILPVALLMTCQTEKRHSQSYAVSHKNYSYAVLLVPPFPAASHL